MKKHEMLGVNKRTYDKVREMQERMNEKNVIRFSQGDIVLLGMLALEEKEFPQEMERIREMEM